MVCFFTGHCLPDVREAAGELPQVQHAGSAGEGKARLRSRGRHSHGVCRAGPLPSGQSREPSAPVRCLGGKGIRLTWSRAEFSEGHEGAEEMVTSYSQIKTFLKTLLLLGSGSQASVELWPYWPWGQRGLHAAGLWPHCGDGERLALPGRARAACGGLLLGALCIPSKPGSTAPSAVRSMGLHRHVCGQGQLQVTFVPAEQ